MTTETSSFTAEQVEAAGTTCPRAYIEAAPGSGKTTVAAERFGVLRYAGESDDRAVVAVSFTKSATRELRRRICRQWGPSALCWPHRVVTIDTVLYELLIYLLRLGLLRWPNRHTELHVMDTWKVRAKHQWTRLQPQLNLQGSDVVVAHRFAATWASRVDPVEFSTYIHAGLCTHDDVRAVLAFALTDPGMASIIIQRIGATMRALIVDEVFDANQLDLKLVGIACKQRLATTIIGDPWQALYRFRGAGPQLVPVLVERYGFDRYPLTRSFRFRTDETQQLSSDLRRKRLATLPERAGQQVDVVLAGRWKDLWAIGDGILPLSFGSPNGPAQAAALLLLDYVTSSTMGLRAVFLDDALTNLGITDPKALDRLAEPFRNVLVTLRGPGRKPEDSAWEELVQAIRTETPRQFPRKHHTHTAQLKQIRDHLLAGPSRLIPGLTVHQAKGREWNVVGVRLTATEHQVLATGLDERIEAHRQLYVALTRARDLTVTV